MSKAMFNELLRYTTEPCCKKCCLLLVCLIQTAKGDDAAYAVLAIWLLCKSAHFCNLWGGSWCREQSTESRLSPNGMCHKWHIASMLYTYCLAHQEIVVPVHHLWSRRTSASLMENNRCCIVCTHWKNSTLWVHNFLYLNSMESHMYGTPFFPYGENRMTP